MSEPRPGRLALLGGMEIRTSLRSFAYVDLSLAKPRLEGGGDVYARTATMDPTDAVVLGRRLIELGEEGLRVREQRARAERRHRNSAEGP